MKIIADENIDRPIIERLRAEEHYVWYIAEMASGIGDDLVLDLANQETAMLLTADKDFGELVYRQQRLNHGVVLIRLAGLSAEHKADIVIDVIGKRSEELPDAFTVITQKTVRIRRPN